MYGQSPLKQISHTFVDDFEEYVHVSDPQMEQLMELLFEYPSSTITKYLVVSFLFFIKYEHESEPHTAHPLFDPYVQFNEPQIAHTFDETDEIDETVETVSFFTPYSHVLDLQIEQNLSNSVIFGTLGRLSCE
jgi:hypothetical protein